MCHIESLFPEGNVVYKLFSTSATSITDDRLPWAGGRLPGQCAPDAMGTVRRSDLQRDHHCFHGLHHDQRDSKKVLYKKYVFVACRGQYFGDCNGLKSLLVVMWFACSAYNVACGVVIPVSYCLPHGFSVKECVEVNYTKQKTSRLRKLLCSQQHTLIITAPNRHKATTVSAIVKTTVT